MLFPQGWQVDILQPNGAGTYPDLSHGTDRYVVGVPGKPFEVRVTAPKALFWSAPLLSVNLLVDGQSVGICKILNEKHPSGTFEGFVNTVKGQHRASQFLFGKPQETEGAAGPASTRDTTTGGLEVTITHVQAGGYQAPPGHTSHPAAKSSKAAEGKKWFMRPSLKADSGDVVGQPITFSTTRYDKIRHMATLTMRMETAAILTLRKVLNPELPAHQAIINASTAAMQPEQSPSSAPGRPAAVLGTGDILQNNNRNQGSGAGPSGQSGVASSKVAGIKRAVKPEPADLSSRPLGKVPKMELGLASQGVMANSEPDLIDLT